MYTVYNSMIQSIRAQLSKALNHSLSPIIITKPAWNKFRNILGRHDADAIKIGVSKIENCECMERTIPRPLIMRESYTLFKPTLSLIQSDAWNDIYALDKKYSPIVMQDEDTRAIATVKTAEILHGINIHYSHADYFGGRFDNRFVFSSTKPNFFLCQCGTIIIRALNNDKCINNIHR